LIEFGWLVLGKIFKNVQLFLLFRYYLPLEKGYPIRLNKHTFPTPKDHLCQVWLELAQWFWRKESLNDPTPFLHFCDYLHFEKDLGLNLKKIEFPSSKNNLYQV
jgi:hypothetical protein